MCKGPARARARRFNTGTQVVPDARKEAPIPLYVLDINDELVLVDTSEVVVIEHSASADGPARNNTHAAVCV